MRIAICDDEPLALAEYQRRLTAIFEEKEIAAHIMPFQRVPELLFALEDQDSEIDLLFLDINMPEKNGIQVAHWIREQNLDCEIVFLTVSREHLLQAFDVQAFHYVIKDVTPEAKLAEICVRAAQRIIERKREVITVTCAGERRVIPIRTIRYFEVQNYIIIVHYDEESFEFYSTLGKIENSLTGRGFVRTHRSYLVNLAHIHRVMRQELELSNGEKVPVGRKYLEDVRALVQQPQKEAVK